MIEKNSVNDLATFAFAQNPIAMLVLDEHATILQLNYAFNQLTGYNEIDCIGKNISFFESDRNETSLYDTIIHTVQDKRGSSQDKTLEMYLLCKNDVHLLVRKNSKYIISDDKQYIILTFEDMTEEKKVLEYYQYLATHDSLTGLANRFLLEDEFKKAQDKATKSHRKMALLLWDVNEFKHCNDKYGHDFGDTVLTVVANTLEELHRPDDTIARYGGDEFVVILEDIVDSDQLAHVITRIKDSFPVTIMHGEKVCQVHMSVGSACFPDDGNDFNTLIQVADEEMYKDKKNFYDSDQSFHSKEK